MRKAVEVILITWERVLGVPLRLHKGRGEGEKREMEEKIRREGRGGRGGGREGRVGRE